MTEDWKVLVVEDDPDIRLSLQVLLGRQFRVFTAEDSISGLIAVRQHAPDAIVLDLGLPGGDGLELLSRMQELPEHAGTPTIVLTGRDGNELEREAIERGASRLFQKPARPAELIEAVHTAIADRPRAPKRVLIVEDHEDTRAALSARMRAEGMVATGVGDGAAALVSARTTRPDLVLLDLGLPCGSGVQVLERLRGIDGLEQVPVVVISGEDAAATRDIALAAGASAFLQKPADDGELMVAVREVL